MCVWLEGTQDSSYLRGTKEILGADSTSVCQQLIIIKHS